MPPWLCSVVYAASPENILEQNRSIVSNQKCDGLLHKMAAKLCQKRVSLQRIFLPLGRWKCILRNFTIHYKAYKS